MPWGSFGKGHICNVHLDLLFKSTLYFCKKAYSPLDGRECLKGGNVYLLLNCEVFGFLRGSGGCGELCLSSPHMKIEKEPTQPDLSHLSCGHSKGNVVA